MKYQNKQNRENSMKLILNDCLLALKEIPDNSVDSVVTDPPYGLSFMGKAWDYDVPKVEVWSEVLRVLKPGGYLLSFAGSRTYHRMAVNIEDAGFEIRDMIEWVYSTGFPKSLNVFKQLKKECTCGNMEAYENRTNKRQGSPSEAEHDLRPLSESHLSQEVHTRQEQGEVLQSGLSEQGTHNEGAEAVAVLQFPEGGEQPSVEGRSDIQKTERELQGSNLPEVSAGVFTNGEERRIHNATQISNGSASKQATDENRGSASQRSQSEQQPDREPCAFCQQYFAQATRTLGIGTALKPAHEPICMARKPLIGTVVENVMEYGTGGINIDGCRVETNESLNGGGYNTSGTSTKDLSHATSYATKVMEKEFVQPTGRFPANLIHDGSDEVVGLFPNNSARFFKVCKDTQKHAIMKVWNDIDVSIAKSNSTITQVIEKIMSITSALVSVPPNLDLLNQNLNALFVEKSADSIEIDFVAKLAAIREIPEDLVSQEELQVIQDFITSSKNFTQTQKNVGVEKWENTDTIQIIINLLKLCGYVLRATDENTSLEKREEVVENGEQKGFLYCPKASKSERNAGCEGLELKGIGVKGNGLGRVCETCGSSQLKPEECLCKVKSWINPAKNGNNHPTVKPVALMQYLVRLVTPPNGTVLDPFMGSGTTGIAAKREGFSFIGIEREPEYVEIAKARIDSA